MGSLESSRVFPHPFLPISVIILLDSKEFSSKSNSIAVNFSSYWGLNLKVNLYKFSKTAVQF